MESFGEYQRLSMTNEQLCRAFGPHLGIADTDYLDQMQFVINPGMFDNGADGPIHFADLIDPLAGKTHQVIYEPGRRDFILRSY